MIKKMYFSLLRLNELLGYFNEIITYLIGADLEGLQITSPVEKLNNKVGEALAAANRTTASGFTERIRQLDNRRDESFVAFRNFMEASTHRRDEAIANAAEQICRIIRTHNWSLYSRGYKIQSAKMASLLKELNQSENQALILQLEAASWYSEMLEDNNAFNQQSEEKSIAKNEEIDYDTQEIYKSARLACEELFEAIEVLNRIAPNEKYNAIAKFINECNQKYLTVARSRKTKNANAAEVTEA
ncbi:hypothetical protein GQR60_14590 [Labilibaculum sp. A4]|uniref:DUF6261 family protein n=1 Tax=Labilibaculum euxinus TaxID=2686357 RepID=UPI000F6216C0|nr:DUF6261 family protein [Labilibaculum euxinus]MDQ1770221.1 DUF6261 family protein [Labilibaculum euxinus]MWN77565.1 hypothetical protein [Labilibaculum euxinus]